LLKPFCIKLLWRKYPAFACNVAVVKFCLCLLPLISGMPRRTCISLAAASSAVAFGRGAVGFIAQPSATKQVGPSSRDAHAQLPVSLVSDFANPGFTDSGITLSAGLGMAAVAALAAQGISAGRRPSAARSKPGNAVVVMKAFENELGVQAPVGFWDPLGISKDGDVTAFKRRRETELKHGRVSMYACIGYIVPEYYKFPGYLSPSQGLKFADIPNGLSALEKVPGTGILQWILFCGVYELFINKRTDEPGNYGKGWLGMGAPMTDADKRKRTLNAELANGRLAMMAIIGMFYQDGLTGSAWGDWSLYTDSPLRAFENELGVQAPVGQNVTVGSASHEMWGYSA